MDFLNAQGEYRVVQLAYLQLVGVYMTAVGQMNPWLQHDVAQEAEAENRATKP